jgi:hypothetical protein
MESSGRGLIGGTISTIAWRDSEKKKEKLVRITCLRAKI